MVYYGVKYHSNTKYDIYKWWFIWTNGWWFKDCHVVCFSAVSCITDIDARLLLEKAVKYAVDNLELHAIIVYTTTYDDSIILDIFKYAVNNNVKIIIPENSLRISNRGKKNGKN